MTGSVSDLADLLIGRDPRRVEHLWQLMFGRYSKGGLVTMSAISGIDQALWDIKAKALGDPGLVGTAIPVRNPRGPAA